MTFEEYATTITWTTVAERTKAKAVWQYQQASIDGLLEDRAVDRARINELEAKVEWLQSVINNAMVPEGYAIVPVADLKQIEDAIAFELGGEPCGLNVAHDLVKAMIQSSNGQANGGE